MPDALSTAPPIRRAAFADLGVWVDETRGHYATLRMVEIAMSRGWQATELDAGLIDWFRHPEREELPQALAAVDVDSLPEMWQDLCSDVEEWFNDHVTPLDSAGDPLASFGWWEGSFHLQTATWWNEEG